MEKLYTLKEVAEITGYKISTLYVYICQGSLKGIKHGCWRFTEGQIKEFLDKKRGK